MGGHPLQQDLETIQGDCSAVASEAASYFEIAHQRTSAVHPVSGLESPKPIRFRSFPNEICRLPPSSLPTDAAAGRFPTQSRSRVGPGSIQAFRLLALKLPLKSFGCWLRQSGAGKPVMPASRKYPYLKQSREAVENQVKTDSATDPSLTTCV